MSTSTNLALDVPDVGADEDTWGTLLVALIGTLDGTYAGASTGLTLPGLFQNYLSGLTLSAAGSTATFGIAAGSAADSTNVAMLRLASAYTKTGASWAVGSGNGGIDTGSIANNTWYHVYIIRRVDTKVNDVLFSLSASSPTLPSDYTLFRRIGSMKTDGSAQWVKFSQVGDEFLWDVPVQDFSNVASGATTAQLLTISVPTGVKVEALVDVNSTYITNAAFIRWSSPDQLDAASSGTVFTHFVNSTAVYVFHPIRMRTDTSARLRYRSSQTDPTYYATTRGWIDTRGK